MVGYIYDFFYTLCMSWYDGIFGGFNVTFITLDTQFGLFETYLPMMFTIVTLCLIVAFCIGLVVWVFKFFANLIKR